MLGDGEDDEDPNNEWEISVPESEAGSPEEGEFWQISKPFRKVNPTQNCE